MDNVWNEVLINGRYLGEKFVIGRCLGSRMEQIGVKGRIGQRSVLLPHRQLSNSLQQLLSINLPSNDVGTL